MVVFSVQRVKVFICLCLVTSAVDLGHLADLEAVGLSAVKFLSLPLLLLPWGDMLKLCKRYFASDFHPPIFASMIDLICSSNYCGLCLVVILSFPLYLY